MKFYRYMNMCEFSRMNAGCTISGKHHHKAHTESIGVCFLAEKTVGVANDGNSHTFTPEKCYEFLSGIVSDEILVEFNVDVDTNQLNKSTGLYADPVCRKWGNYICINEYCTPYYNRDTFVPVRYCFPGESIWYSFN